jgi:hypothetical protein
MMLSQWRVDLERRRGSQSLADTVPGFSDIVQRARTIEVLAGQDRQRDAA